MVTVRYMFNENKSCRQIKMKEKGKSTKAPFLITVSNSLSSKKRLVEKATSFPQSERTTLPLQRIWAINRRVWGPSTENK